MSPSRRAIGQPRTESASARAAARAATAAEPDPGMFLGRGAELARLRAAMEARVGVAICGPADAGKTALVRQAVAQLAGETARNTVHVRAAGAPHGMLCALLGELHARGDALLAAKFRGEARRGEDFPRWAEKQTSLRLRGLLYRAAQAGRYWLVLDDVDGMSDAFARIVRELSVMRDTPVYVIAAGYSERELGRAARLYWNGDLRIGVGPLGLRHARELVERCIRRFGLARLNLEGFREAILRASGRLPGAIVNMCARAADPQYHCGGKIESRLLHVDYMMRYAYQTRRGAAPPATEIPGAAAAAASGMK